MRIIPFPHPAGAPDEPTLAEIEAALHGDAVGEDAEQWRDLRADVRALAPPLPPELERRLRERIEADSAGGRRREPIHRRARPAFANLLEWLGAGGHRRALAVLAPVLAAAIVTLALVRPWHTEEFSSASETAKPASGQIRDFSRPASGSSQPYIRKGGTSGAAASAAAESAPSGPRNLAHANEAATSAPARVQQRAAALTLAAKPAEVQSLSDRVAQLAVREGGVVQSSQVHLESGTAGEANLHLSLPSARLSTALASLARLAPTRAESQSLQDITDEYDASKRKLSDAVAERQALLHALSRASTQGEIESLHARLSLASGAITNDREAFESISKRGSNANVEVSVIGNAHATSGGGLSVSRGLHDAGDVLRASLAVLLIVLAVLVPLAILAALAGFGWRASRRRVRERALG
jgi:hypothetical protein